MVGWVVGWLYIALNAFLSCPFIPVLSISWFWPVSFPPGTVVLPVLATGHQAAEIPLEALDIQPPKSIFENGLNGFYHLKSFATTKAKHPHSI